MEEKRLNRRDFLRGSVMAAVGIVAASCAAPTPVVVEKQVPVERVVKETVVVKQEVPVERVVKETVVVKQEVPVEKVVKETVVVRQEVPVEKVVTATPIPTKFNEAPALTELVKAGQLPPVDERVPIEPLVVTPVEEIGTYGGAWRQVHIGENDRWQNSYIMFERIAKYSPDFVQILPNVCKSWQFSSDGKEITLNLRPGMKWSDGRPFTAEDIIFWWEDVALYKEITASPPSRYRIEGEVAMLTKVDAFSVKFTFPKAYGSYEDFMPAEAPWMPAHYHSRFHAKYASASALDAAMKAEGVNTWTDLFAAKNRPLDTPGQPTLQAWNPINKVDQPLQIFERNPFYWKVDTAGNQLPYLDRVERTLVSDREAMLLKVLAGETEYQARNVATLVNRPVVSENATKSGYRLLPVKSPGTNWGTIFLNFHHQDPVLKELFNTLDFRIALSVAINRDEANALVDKGQAFPGQATCAIGSPWYEERFLKIHAEYDPAQANALLDGLGLDRRDAQGYRLRSDGKRLSIVISIFGTGVPMVTKCEIYQKGWEAVGIETVLRSLDNQLWVQTVHAVEHDVAVYAANLGFWGNPPMVRETFCTYEPGIHWAPQWALYYDSQGEQGEEPPDDIKKLQAMFEEVKAEISAAKRIQIQKDALTLHADNLWMIGYGAEADIGRYTVVKNSFRNVPTDFAFDIETIHPASFFIKQ